MRHQEIIFALAGQSFEYDVPEGRPDDSPAAAVQVFLQLSQDDGPPVLATTGSVAIDAVNTTLSAPAAARATSVTLTAVDNMQRRRRYLMTAPNGETEWVQVVGIDTGTKIVKLRRPLTNAFANGSSFASTRLSIGVDASWDSNTSNLTDILGVEWHTDRLNHKEWLAGYVGYRLRWTYSVAGVAQLGVGYADLVRYQAKNLITPLDVDARFPGWIDRLPTDCREDQGALFIEEAFRALKMDAIGDDQAVRRIRETQVLGELTMHRAVVIAAEDAVLNGRADKTSLELAMQLYERRYVQLLREPKVQVDQTGSGSGDRANRLPAFRR